MINNKWLTEFKYLVFGKPKIIVLVRILMQILRKPFSKTLLKPYKFYEFDFEFWEFYS